MCVDFATYHVLCVQFEQLTGREPKSMTRVFQYLKVFSTLNFCLCCKDIKSALSLVKALSKTQPRLSS